MTQPNKTFLSNASLDFAMAHIASYYDTDFFPRTQEFLALQHHWPEVRQHLMDTTLDAMFSAAPIVEPWPKPRAGYRIVHRLEPLDSIIYAAMAKVILVPVELSRASPEVACSYRLVDQGTSFFGEGSGFEVFRARCTALASAYPYVLSTDIADFYNKIYLHRLQGAIQLATDNPTGISKRIEHFLNTLNTKASQGIPVGPAASIAMSEATLIDVDKFLLTKGVEHVRYVDDFRVFATSREQLQALLQDFTVYLHENHRLSLNSGKTTILASAQFLQEEINNQYTLEKLQIFDAIEAVETYGGTWADSGFDVDDGDDSGDADVILLESLNKLLKYQQLDLGLIRIVIRRARAKKLVTLAPILLAHLGFVAPAINDVVLYLDAISSPAYVHQHKAVLAAACSDPAMHTRVVRHWFQWYFSRQVHLLNIPAVRAFVFASDHLRPQAQAAITLKLESWVKERKTKVLHYASWDRRSVLLAASLLAKDEREKWLEPLIGGNSLDPMDKWMARWVRAGSPA